MTFLKAKAKMDEPTICPICGHSFAACSHDAEAVAAFEVLLKENRELKQKLETARADAIAAAGEMLLDVPKPGTDAAKMFIVNRMLQRERDALNQEIEELNMTTAKLRVILKDGRADRKQFTRLKDAVSALIPHIHDDGMCGETDFEKRVMELEKRWKIVLKIEDDNDQP